MAKGLNLVTTNISELRLNVSFDDADIKYLVEVIDDNGDVVRYDSVVTRFSALPTQIRAQLNGVMRALSREANRDKVNEDKETWSDI
jgi:hypothetical protein